MLGWGFRVVEIRWAVRLGCQGGVLGVGVSGGGGRLGCEGTRQTGREADTERQTGRETDGAVEKVGLWG